MTYVAQCIVLSISLTLLGSYIYTENTLLKSGLTYFNYVLLSNVSVILTNILSHPMSMKNDYEEDESNVIEYTESSVEDYFNTYMRLEQKYTMRPRYGIARAIYERSLRDEAIENFDKSTVSACLNLYLIFPLRLKIEWRAKTIELFALSKYH